MIFWVLDDQSKYILARSVVRPFNQNLRVKWDPALASDEEKITATHGGDTMPEKPSVDPDIENDDDDLPDLLPRPKSMARRDQSVLKPTYENPGIDNSCLTFPKEIITRSKGKLKLDNVPIPIDESIKTFVRDGKRPYKEVKYKSGYIPTVNHGEVPKDVPEQVARARSKPQQSQRKSPLRRSARNKKKQSLGHHPKSQ